MEKILAFLGTRLVPQQQEPVTILDAETKSDPTPYYVAGGVAVAALVAAYFIIKK